jgi:hypothetical protein
MIKRIKRFFKGDKSMQIRIVFTPLPDGKYKVRTEQGHNVPVSHALEALDKMQWNLRVAISNKCRIHGYDSNNPKTRTFQKKQRIGDLR